MSRGKSKKPRQAEKLLVVLLDGREVSLTEIEATLGTVLQMYRIPSYIWDLKHYMNAQVKTIKQGRNVTAIQLLNVEEMKTYALDRGLIAPPPIELKPEDLMVAAG